MNRRRRKSSAAWVGTKRMHAIAKPSREMRTFRQQTGRLVESGRGVDVAMLLADTAPAPTSNIARPSCLATDGTGDFRGRRGGCYGGHRPVAASTSDRHERVGSDAAGPRVAVAGWFDADPGGQFFGHRSLHLQERVLVMHGNAGEAFFAVAKNLARPFIVKVDDVLSRYRHGIQHTTCQRSRSRHRYRRHRRHIFAAP